eukprot:gene12612-biopygen4785
MRSSHPKVGGIKWLNRRQPDLSPQHACRVVGDEGGAQSAADTPEKPRRPALSTFAEVAPPAPLEHAGAQDAGAGSCRRAALAVPSLAFPGRDLREVRPKGRCFKPLRAQETPENPLEKPRSPALSQAKTLGRGHVGGLRLRGPGIASCYWNNAGLLQLQSDVLGYWVSPHDGTIDEDGVVSVE